MKRRILLTILITLAAVCLFAFAACNKEEEKPEVQSYTIQYHDGTQNRTISVKDGDLYDIPVPEKTGYNFLGLFNAREGGVQYVDENGSCLMPFGGSSNLILFAQYEAKTYSVAFDYGEAGDSIYTCTVAYDENIPMPPQPSYVYGSEFVGWFTAKDMGGEQIATASAMDYIKSVLNYENYNLDNLPSGRLVLYAGFKLDLHEVKFYSDDGRELITTKNIEHGTDINDLDEITYNGKVVLAWGRTVKGTPFTGAITDPVSLYAIKYGIKINFDSDGGSEVSLNNLTAGDTVSLPEPTKQYYRFVCWTENGEPVTKNFTVPDRVVNLVARWEQEFKDYKYISIAQEFIDIKNDVNGKYMLITDLDLTNVNYEPLAAFGGEFNGNNFTIELGNKVYSPDIQSVGSEIYYGWFAGINRGKIENFTVKNLVVKSTRELSGSVYLGGICGTNVGTVSNVHIINSTAGNASETEAQISNRHGKAACGGICGTNDGILTNCSAAALVFGDCDTGGIVGASSTAISNCRFTGKIGIYLELHNGNILLRAWGGIVGHSTTNVIGCSVNSCSFEYWGENSKYHNVYNGFHVDCRLKPHVGIICGATDSESNLSGNTYSNCVKDLVLKGGNNHYGSYEKSNLFRYLDGMLGMIVA